MHGQPASNLRKPQPMYRVPRYDGVVSMRGTGWTHYEKAHLTT